MRQVLLAVALGLAPSLAQAADAILFAADPGQTLYVRVLTGSTTSVAAALTEGSGNGVGRYAVTDATLAGAGLSGTAIYPYKVFSGAPSTSADDPVVGVGSLYWVSTAAGPPPVTVASMLDNVLTAAAIAADAIGASEWAASAVAEIQTALALTPVAASEIRGSRTWRPSPFDGSAAENLVTVKRLFAGDLQAFMPLNDGADIDDVDSVTITGAATVTATNLRLAADGLSVIFTVPSLTTAGTYTVTVTVTTKDGQTIPMECRLIVKT